MCVFLPLPPSYVSLLLLLALHSVLRLLYVLISSSCLPVSFSSSFLYPSSLLPFPVSFLLHHCPLQTPLPPPPLLLFFPLSSVSVSNELCFILQLKGQQHTKGKETGVVTQLSRCVCMCIPSFLLPLYLCLPQTVSSTLHLLFSLFFGACFPSLLFTGYLQTVLLWLLLLNLTPASLQSCKNQSSCVLHFGLEQRLINWPVQCSWDFGTDDMFSDTVSPL